MKISPLQTWIGAKIGCDEENYDRALLEEYQLDRLQKVIKTVKEKSSFYRQLFTHSPEFPHSLQELTVYSFTNPQDIQNDPNRFICVSQDEIQRIVTLPTSGTTGPPKRIFFTASDQELTIDFFRVGMSNLANQGDRVLILLPGQRPGSVGDLLRIGLERLGCISYPYGPVDDEESILKLIRDQDIHVLVGAPVQIQQLARWDRTYHILSTGQIRSVLNSTDYLADTIISNLQKIWGCEVFDHYGLTETGLGGGVECLAHQGLHMREADLLFEVIHPKTGIRVTDGEVGEVVVTTLTRTGMPLIRYRTGDYSRFVPGVCVCGSFIKRLEKIKSRMNAGIRLNSGTVFQSDLDEAMFQVEKLLDFSAKFEGNSDSTLLTLAVRLTEGKIGDLRESFIKALRRISPLRTEMDAGTLRVEISQMGKNNHAQTGYMFKRVLVDKRATIP